MIPAALVRELIVEAAVAAGANGATPKQIRDRVTQGAGRVGVKLTDPIDNHLASLLRLGVLEYVPEDSRRFRATDLSGRYLVGSKIIAPEATFNEPEEADPASSPASVESDRPHSQL